MSEHKPLCFGAWLWIIIWLTLMVFVITEVTADAGELDGKLYFGIFDTVDKRAQPDGDTIAKFITGVEIGYTFGKKDNINLRPYTVLETIMDEYHDGEGTFHPASIDYKIGLDLNFYKGLHLIAEHSCWHPVDRAGTVEVYNLIKIEWRF
jgi:hypothetical protein